ncbi:tetratricopeptide repeat protein [Granulicella rosea]|nr:hypothetical protein [Granulicella rosea]
MRKSVGSRIAVAAVASLLVSTSLTAPAQAKPDRPVMLSTWFGVGAIPLPAGTPWKLEGVKVYDKGQRPVATYHREDNSVTLSYIVFENLSGQPTGKGCQGDVIDPLAEHFKKTISGRADGEVKDAAGNAMATTSYLLELAPGVKQKQHNLFGFVGTAKTCFEIHLSNVTSNPADETVMAETLAAFRPELAYQPNAMDYFTLASLLFPTEPGSAAPYYKESLDRMSDGPESITPRRVATDQLVISLGMSGDLKNSRAVAEMAVAKDPDYPLNYYNLACADAEEGKAAEARLHLQQAFDQRANVLPGEQMPDPVKDDSILKLKKDKAFWSWVQTLPRSGQPTA